MVFNNRAYQVTQVIQQHGKSLVDKPRYTIRNLVTDKEYVVDVTHIRPFYYDPTYVTPLNIAVKDTDETVVDMIVKHDFSDPKDHRATALPPIFEYEIRSRGSWTIINRSIHRFLRTKTS